MFFHLNGLREMTLRAKIILSECGRKSVYACENEILCSILRGNVDVNIMCTFNT